MPTPPRAWPLDCGCLVRKLIDTRFLLRVDALVHRFQISRSYLAFVHPARSAPLRPPPAPTGAGQCVGYPGKAFPGCKPPESVKRDRCSPPLSGRELRIDVLEHCILFCGFWHGSRGRSRRVWNVHGQSERLYAGKHPAPRAVGGPWWESPWGVGAGEGDRSLPVQAGPGAQTEP